METFLIILTSLSITFIIYHIVTSEKREDRVTKNDKTKNDSNNQNIKRINTHKSDVEHLASPEHKRRIRKKYKIQCKVDVFTRVRA